MAKKSLVAKARRKQKFAVREYNRCLLCGRPRAFFKKIFDVPNLFQDFSVKRRNSRSN